jgi:flagellum-specific peptidoglycan hydrolase FlgJ
MEQYKKDFLIKAAQCAARAQHIFPEYAACEAALESAFGTSGLSVRANNLFGMKQHAHPLYGTLSLPTKEWVGKEKDTKDGVSDGWITVSADWVLYPNWESSFTDRMATLRRLSTVYPHYKAALLASTGETFINEVSQTWSTDPKRGQKVLDIHKLFFGGVATHA